MPSVEFNSDTDRIIYVQLAQQIQEVRVSRQ